MSSPWRVRERDNKRLVTGNEGFSTKRHNRVAKRLNLGCVNLALYCGIMQTRNALLAVHCDCIHVS